MSFKAIAYTMAIITLVFLGGFFYLAKQGEWIPVLLTGMLLAIFAHFTRAYWRLANPKLIAPKPRRRRGGEWK